MAVAVERFRAHDQGAVRALILDGLIEHWGTPDPALNPDLDDLAGAYADGTILVARVADEIVGVGILVAAGVDVGEVKRMSVARSFRRQRIASALLDALVDEARTRGYRAVELETTTSWADAVAFYVDSGFTHTHDADGPFGSESHFRLDLT